MENTSTPLSAFDALERNDPHPLSHRARVRLFTIGITIGVTFGLVAFFG
jgi:hypothetical protein